ncbi:hypothetical protein MKW98_001497 [Papaver atlanticum]|uniref:Uncharacterized protein n=1 Tax=Papaver atlanticum TaxID=357466 RepID=A0AAD4SXI0_9MAGN|nr:hypothetical protein MKW98_001497 [Papaver atlanticum]
MGKVGISPCSWSDHTSPEGYKYYNNSVTSGSRQRQQGPNKAQSHQIQVVAAVGGDASVVGSDVSPATAATTFFKFTVPGIGFVGHLNAQEFCYAQSQVSANSGLDPACFYQGLQAREWTRKTNPQEA